MVIFADWLVRRRRFFSGEAGGVLDSSGGYGGNYVLRINVVWNRLAETWSDDVFYDTLFATGLLGQDWLVILGNLLLNLSTIVTDAVKSLW